MILWLKHIRAIPVVLSACAATAVVYLLILLLPGQDGGILPIASLWLALALSVPLLFLFTHETVWDRLSVRPVTLRRAVVVAAVVVIVLLVSLLCYPDNLLDSGMTAMMRNCLGLIGLGLLSTVVVPRWAIWIAPAVVGLASMVFSVPANPGSGMSLWGALRMPGGLHNPEGAADLSWVLCGAVFLLGSILYVVGTRVPPRRRSLRASSTGDAARLVGGISRSMFLPWVCVAVAVILSWTPASAVKYWGGSSYLLLSSYVPMSVLFAAPVACAGGCVAGQYRWRSSLSPWESLSAQGQGRVLAGVLMRVAAWSGLTVSGVILVMGVIGVAGQYADGVRPDIIRGELVDSLDNVIGTIAIVVLSATVGALVGFGARRIWLPPLALLIAFVLAVPGVGMIREPDARPFADSSAGAGGGGSNEDVACQGSAPQICAHARDAGYVPVLGEALGEIYSASSFEVELPDTVKVVDNAEAGPSVLEAPTVGLSGVRGLRAPHHVDADALRETLIEELGAACRRLDAGRPGQSPGNLPMMDVALRPSLDGVTDEDVETARRSLAAARDCYARAEG